MSVGSHASLLLAFRAGSDAAGRCRFLAHVASSSEWRDIFEQVRDRP